MLEFESADILRIFMGNYEPWEVEEIVCIYTFAKTKFNQVFDDIPSDVHQDNPRFDGLHRPPTPQGTFNFDSGCKFCISFALSLLLLFSPHTSTTSNHLIDRHQGSPSGGNPLPWPRAAA